MSLEDQHIPASLPHTFDSYVLANHFNKNPLPPGACALIDLPADLFVDTEEEINLIAACLWVLSVKYDNLPLEERPMNKEGVAKWIFKHSNEVVERLAGKVEPPFHAWTLEQVHRDIGAMMEGLLSKTLPQEKAKAK